MLLVGVSFYGCKTSAEKVKKAEENVSDANDELDKENAALKKEMEDYKKEQQALIEANEKSITEFNMRIANEKSEAKADYEKKIAELNQKNSDLKKKMNDFNTSNRISWEQFKDEFGRDMSDLGTALRDFTIKGDKKENEK